MSETAKNTLIVEQIKWDLMSEKDQLWMKQMGFDRAPDKVSKTKKEKNPVTLAARNAIRNTAPVGYYVNVISKCSCCGEVTEKTGKMALPYERAPYLKFRELDPGELLENVKIQRKERNFCGNCETNLLEMPKEKLVHMILSGNKYFEKNYKMPSCNFPEGKEVEELETTVEEEVLNAECNPPVAS